jgi:hypothetical protein
MAYRNKVYVSMDDAPGNYWGAPDGPSGAGRGSGDPVGTGIDFSGYLSDPIPSGTCDCAVGAKNHGDYVSCVVQAANEAYKAGLITKAERKALKKAAAQSDIGK